MEGAEHTAPPEEAGGPRTDASLRVDGLAQPSSAAPATGLRHHWSRLQRFVVHNVLHLDDTSHRIALGVFLGFLVGASPTLGLQMVLYFGIAAVVRANKVSGLGPIWITNPLTAAPIYYGNWRLGGLLMTGRLETSEASREAIEKLVTGPPGGDMSLFQRIVSAQFWQDAWAAFQPIGIELWVGSLFVGVVTGVVGYVVTLRAVNAHRRRQAAASAAPTASP